MYYLSMVMDIRFKNLLAVMAVIGLLIIGVVVYYFSVIFGAIAIGTVSNVAQTASLNLSQTLTNLTSDTETDFANNVETANTVIPIVFSLVSLLAIMMIFGFDPFRRQKQAGGGSIQ